MPTNLRVATFNLENLDDIPGQEPTLDERIALMQPQLLTWQTPSGWAEGFSLSSMKRVGQALETRIPIDSLFGANEDALIVVCGDFNADLDEVLVETFRGDVENTGNDKLAKRGGAKGSSLATEHPAQLES
jgi:hypothetical protein